MVIKRILSVVAKTFSVLFAGGAVLNALGLTSASRGGGLSNWLPLLSAALSVAMAIGLWRLGSWLSPPIVIQLSPSAKQKFYQANMKQAAFWCMPLLLVLGGFFVLLAAAPSIGEPLLPILPYITLAFAVALVRFCWYFVRARGRWKGSDSQSTTADKLPTTP